MENNEYIYTSDIEKLEHSGFVKLTCDVTFNYTSQQLKDEVFQMFMSYVQSLETELDETQKAHVFHFARLYDFYDRLGNQIKETKNVKAKRGKK